MAEPACTRERDNSPHRIGGNPCGMRKAKVKVDVRRLRSADPTFSSFEERKAIEGGPSVMDLNYNDSFRSA